MEASIGAVHNNIPLSLNGVFLCFAEKPEKPHPTERFSGPKPPPIAAID